MIKHSRVQGGFRGAAKLTLRAVVAAAIGFGFAVSPAQAAGHPVRLAEARQAAAHQAAARRRVVQTVPDNLAARSRARGAAKHRTEAKPRTAANQATPRSAGRADRPSKSRRPRRRRQEDADNDPVVLHRARTRVSRQKRTANPKGLLTTRAVKRDDTAETKAGIPVETIEQGIAHLDEEKLPEQYLVPGVAASVTAAPEPVTPAGKASLPEKLHAAAAKAETAVKADAASAKESIAGRRPPKGSVLPDDHAGKVAVIEQAMTPMILPTLYTRHGRLIIPPPLKGSREILVHQNTMADNEGLDRIQNDNALDRMRELGLLQPLRGSASLLVNDGLPLNRRYARPWAARFATDTARAFYARFHQPLRLNSAVRTVEYQIRLQRVNGNAAAADGDGASPHLTGQALDFGKRGMSVLQIAWMRAYLAPLMQAGKVDVEEEFQQACFHVSVYSSYRPALKTTPTPSKAAPKMEVAQAHGELAAAASGVSSR